jgi:hypothetical protein
MTSDNVFAPAIADGGDAFGRKNKIARLQDFLPFCGFNPASSQFSSVDGRWGDRNKFVEFKISFNGQEAAMNRNWKNGETLRKSGILLLMMAVPSLMLGQHKNESKPSAPAKSAPAKSAPAHNSSAPHSTTPSHSTATGTSHSATTSHATTAGHTTTPSHSTAATSHTTTTSHTATTSHTTPAGRTATTTHSTATSHTTTASHTPPGRTVSLKGGGSASVRPNGQIRSIDRGGMHIEHGVGGGRTVVSEHNGARIVTTGHGGYVQRAYVVRGGRTFVSRTYVVGGVAHVGVYRSYYWGGRPYYGYYHPFWFHPGFYGWGWHPWGAPVAWGIGAWGWGGSPWWGFYAGWWNPYPVYAAPYYWLTDYLISQQLQAAYAARADANANAMAADADASANYNGGGPAPASSGQAALSPEVKEAIAEEVKAQLAAQQNEAGAQGASAQGGAAGAAPAAANGQVPPALDPAQRTFVVNAPVTAMNNGQECGLTGGDVVTRLTDTPDADNMVNVSVSASKKADCASGQTVAVKVDDLQEMYNHFQEQLTNGMSEMAKKQGTGGMPAAPDTGTTPSDVPAPAPDATAAKALQDQQAAADQTEAQVKQETASGGGTQ